MEKAAGFKKTIFIEIKDRLSDLRRMAIAVLADEGIFLSTLPDKVPDYYSGYGMGCVYAYRKKDGRLCYRVHGKIDGFHEGFYEANSDGTLVKPKVLLNQEKESRYAL